LQLFVRGARFPVWLPLLGLFASGILAATGADGAAGLDSGLSKYAGSWSAVLRYDSPTLPVTSSEIHPWSVQLQAQLTVDEEGTISGAGRVTIEPERYEEGGKWVHVVSPTEFGVNVTGRITLVEEGIKVTLEYRNVPPIARRVTKYYHWQGGWVEDFSYDGLFTRPTYLSFVCTETEDGKTLTPSKGLVIEGLYRDFAVEGGFTRVTPPPAPVTITVSVLYGSVQRVLDDGTEIPLTTTEITEVMRVITHERSYVEYWIEKYVRIRQGEKTVFEFKETKLIEGGLLSLLHRGTIYGFIGADRKIDFFFKTPAALALVSGTEFILEVAEDSSTTLTVLGGEVEFSDLNRTKIVLVGRSQTSTVKLGGLPSESRSVDPAQIDRWWERSAEVPDPYLGTALALAVVSIASVLRKGDIKASQ